MTQAGVCISRHDVHALLRAAIELRLSADPASPAGQGAAAADLLEHAHGNVPGSSDTLPALQPMLVAMVEDLAAPPPAGGGFRPGFDLPATEDTLDALAHLLHRLIDMKSPYTADHSLRVARLCTGLGTRLGLPAPDLAVLRRSALLHDIGKLGMPDVLLRSRDILKPAERSAIRRHAELGETLLAVLPDFAREAAIVGAHHEFLDATGYPRGLSATEIAPIAHIVTVADVFDALTVARPYRAAMTAQDAIALMRADFAARIDGTMLSVLAEMQAGA